jgi:hypothetical protein
MHFLAAFFCVSLIGNCSIIPPGLKHVHVWAFLQLDREAMEIRITGKSIFMIEITKEFLKR